MPEYIDIHSHLNFASYDEDREEVIKRTLQDNTWIINVGTQKKTSKLAVEIAEKYQEGIYATIGLHPIHTEKSFHDKDEIGEEGDGFNSKGEVFDTDYYRDLSKSSKVLAIGECGLDYFRIDESYKEKQKKAFVEQIDLANSVEKPLMLHIRDAYKDSYEILKSEAKVKGNLHFFSGDKEIIKKFLDLGFYLSFTGVITFASNYKELVEYVPMDRIMSETDCPYVTPHPYRGKRNEPLYVKEVVKKMAEIKGVNLEEMKDVLIKNANNFFNIKNNS